jgi:hypothetical protein
MLLMKWIVMNYKNVIILCTTLLGFSGQLLCAASSLTEMGTIAQEIERVATGVRHVEGMVQNPINAALNELYTGRAFPNTDAEFRQNLLRYITLLANKMEDYYLVGERDPATPYERDLAPAFTEEQRAAAFGQIHERAESTRARVPAIRELFRRALNMHTRATAARQTLTNHLAAPHSTQPAYRAHITHLQEILTGENRAIGGAALPVGIMSRINPNLLNRTTTLCQQFGMLYELEDRAAQIDLRNLGGLNLAQAAQEASLLMRDHFKTLAQYEQELEHFVGLITPQIEALETEMAGFSAQVTALNTPNEAQASQALTEELTDIMRERALTTNNKTRLRAILTALESANHKPANALRLDMHHILEENDEFMRRMPPEKDTRVTALVGIALVASLYPLYQLYTSQKKYTERLNKKAQFTAIPREEKAEIFAKLNHWSVKWVPLWARRALAVYKESEEKLVDDQIEEYYQAHAARLKKEASDAA